MPARTLGHRALRALGASLCVGIVSVVLLVGPDAEARTRSFCSGLVTRTCGGHLQPACSTSPACNDGFSSYSGSPFPITIECPSILKDVVVSSGCYDTRPDCNDCSASGQIPCPAEAEPWCTQGCDGGLAPDPLTGLCDTPRTAGDSCGPAAPCAPGFSCNPFLGFKCVQEAGVDEFCGDAFFVVCEDDLQCTLGSVCSHEPARLDESCDATASCDDGLFCQIGTQRCAARRGLGEACGPAAQCQEGLGCDPFAGFVCVDAAGPSESCAFKPCRDDLVCTVTLECVHSPALVGEACDLFHRCGRGSFCDPGPGVSGPFNGECRAYRKPGQTCMLDPDFGDDCTPDAECNPFITDDSFEFRCVVDGSGQVIPDNVCSSLYAPQLRSDAISSGDALSFGSGGESAAGVGASQESGVVYGEDGRYGCYYARCDGISIDAGWEVYAVAGLTDRFDDVAGYSWVGFEEAQIANVVNFSTMQVFARDDAQDLTPGALIGTADAVSLGTPTNPSPVAGGAMLCTTTVSEIDLFENDYGVIEPLAVAIPEPGGAALGAGALGALGLLRSKRSARRRLQRKQRSSG